MKDLVALYGSDVNEVAQYYGYKDAEDFKVKQRFTPASRFDIKYDKNTNELWIVDKNGMGESTGYMMPSHLKRR